MLTVSNHRPIMQILPAGNQKHYISGSGSSINVSNYAISIYEFVRLGTLDSIGIVDDMVRTRIGTELCHFVDSIWCTWWETRRCNDDWQALFAILYECSLHCIDNGVHSVALHYQQTLEKPSLCRGYHFLFQEKRSDFWSSLFTDKIDQFSFTRLLLFTIDELYLSQHLIIFHLQRSR
jgi:hypothetical protein